MFCTTCGKQIIDEARFCNFCGAPVRGATPPPVSPTSQTRQPAPVSEPFAAPTEHQPFDAPASETEGGSLLNSAGGADNAENTADASAPIDNSGSESAENTFGARPAAYAAENAGQPYGAAFASAAPVYPMPGEIPQSGGDPSGNYSAPIEGSSAYAAPEKPKPERKYTLTHIILCLASTAIMAIAAGVFAGLYFSVV